MQRSHRLTSALVALVMALSAAGSARAAGALIAPQPQMVTRAQFIRAFDAADGIQPSSPQTPTFKDVPQSDPDYGYIEAAVQNGIISGLPDGSFDPQGGLTREQVAKIEVLALGRGAAALALQGQATAFKDNAETPAWVRGYIQEAASLDLIHGYPDGAFHPTTMLSPQDLPHFLAQYTAEKQQLASEALTIIPSASDVAVGQKVTLSATDSSGAPVSASYTISSPNAVLSGNAFIASASGAYVIAGTAANGAMGTATVTVYGTPAALKIVPPQGVVANGETGATVKVDVVDAAGNVVADNTSAITLASGSPYVSVETKTENAIAGVATFSLTAGNVPGAEVTLTATDGSLKQGIASVATLAQVPASLQLSAAEPSVENNDGRGTDVFSAVVLDQTGNPMLSGVYPITFGVSGPGTLQGGTTFSAAYVGNSTGQSAQATIIATQAGTGAITVTATSGKLSASASTTALTVQYPTALEVASSVTSVSADTAAQDGTSRPIATLQITSIDSSGHPSAWSGQVAVSEYLNGLPSSNLGVVQSVTFDNQTSMSVNVYGNPSARANQAGAYTFAVSTTGAADLRGARASFSITPGVPAAVLFTAPTSPVYVSLKEPSVTVTAQIEDAEGNAVTEAGFPLQFATAGQDASRATLSASDVPTNAEGQASTTLTAEPYIGDSYTVTVTGLTGSGIQNTATSQAITMQQTATASLVASLTVGGSIFAQAGQPATLQITTKDSYGNPTTGDFFSLTPTAGILVGVGDTGVTVEGATYSGTAQQLESMGFLITGSGQQSVTVTDTATAQKLTATADVEVQPGPLAQFVLVDGSGDPLIANAEEHDVGFTPGQPVEIWLRAEDLFGNQVTDPVANTVSLLDLSGQNGTFRLSPSGADVTTVDLAAGEGSIPVYFVNQTQATVYDSLLAR